MKQHTKIQRKIRDELHSTILCVVNSMPAAHSITDDPMMIVDEYLFYLEAKKIGGEYDSYFNITFNETVYKIHKQTEIALYNQLNFLWSLEY